MCWQAQWGFFTFRGATLQENFSQNLFVYEAIVCLFPISWDLEVKLARKQFWYISCRDACYDLYNEGSRSHPTIKDIPV